MAHLKEITLEIESIFFFKLFELLRNKLLLKVFTSKKMFFKKDEEFR